MNCLNILNKKRDFTKDIEHVKSLSEKIEKKLSQSNIPDDAHIDKLSFEELQDIDKILGLANFLLCKYDEKKETRSILQHFVSIISESAQSIEGLDDEISELIISAEDSINKVKDMYANISDKSDFDGQESDEESSSINLTNFDTEINTIGYQQNSQEETAQVI
ncbi:hypothetical protein NsoK4_02305 [Nitrosopumilus sp. K4]|uniref:hypothetical protein n=1 Tax=Nitrosopumilus sp. K4 TaxID=2795383 RepID=UPI001BACF91F|nr:hypothetical protein [Nitrosopumilus sp. K4]QUC65117.1 hypothetical protein NsoK4_02305 [Nitrosopumilus sp. K4]